MWRHVASALHGQGACFRVTARGQQGTTMLSQKMGSFDALQFSSWVIHYLSVTIFGEFTWTLVKKGKALIWQYIFFSTLQQYRQFETSALLPCLPVRWQGSRDSCLSNSGGERRGAKGKPDGPVGREVPALAADAPINIYYICEAHDGAQRHIKSYRQYRKFSNGGPLHSSLMEATTREVPHVVAGGALEAGLWRCFAT